MRIRRSSSCRLGSRLEPELLREIGARPLVRAQRLCLTAAAVEREHVLGAETLVNCELLAQDLQFRDEIGMAAERQLGLDPCLDRVQPSSSRRLASTSSANDPGASA